MPRTLKLAIFAGVLALLALLAWGVVRPGTNEASPLEGREAFDFTVDTFDGRRIALSHFRGRPVVLNFFASWCLACVDEARILEEAWRSYGPRGAVFVGVAVSDRPDAALEFARRHGKTYLLGLDRNGSIGLDYGLFGVPETVFIGPDGRIAGKTIGPVTPEIVAAHLERWL